MQDITEMIDILRNKVRDYDEKRKLSLNITPDYYDPGNMENLDQYAGSINENGRIMIKVDVKGLRYCNRTSRLELCKVSDAVELVRDAENVYNPCNFNVVLSDGFVIGTLPADLCNSLAPLYDANLIEVKSSKISYLEQLRDRSRYAKQGILFVELDLRIKS